MMKKYLFLIFRTKNLLLLSPSIRMSYGEPDNNVPDGVIPAGVLLLCGSCSDFHTDIIVYKCTCSTTDSKWYRSKIHAVFFSKTDPSFLYFLSLKWNGVHVCTVG